MQTLLIALAAGVGFIVAYHTYGRWLGSKIFQLSADAVCPSKKLEDGNDYVPTAKSIVFGHHFTSIAGTGPIVGPAIAVIWGWLPALLWVILGSIFIGAVHDFGSLVVSLRNRGQTVGQVAGRLLNKRVRLLFLLVLFMALTIVLAIFGLVIAAVFKTYPAATFPCLVQIPIAVGIGVWLHRKGVHLLMPSLIALAVMYLTVIYGNVGFLGDINSWLAGQSMMWWVIVLLIYSYIASVLPVWILLQPRDYINSLQLMTALALIVIGLFAAAFMGGPAPVEGVAAQPLTIVAPMVNWSPEGAPLIFPFLFITIACGAISGFHCLVSSGTSSKQLKSESDAKFVGFGSMLTEGFLATIVILACVAGLGLGVTQEFTGDVAITAGTQAGQTMHREGNEIVLAGDGAVGSGDVTPRVLATLNPDGPTILGDTGMYLSSDATTLAITGAAVWPTRYENWGAAGSLKRKVGAFVDGAANFLRSIGLPAGVATALMGVLVASFAGTTLDTACRLQRYVVQELASTFLPKLQPGDDSNTPRVSALNPLTWLANKHGATLFAIVVAMLMAAAPPAGKEWSWANAGQGGMILWPMFGATNQLLGGLAFLVITFYLWRRGKPIWFLVLPLIFMLIMPAWAMGYQLFSQESGWIAEKQKNWPLIVIAIATLAFEAWMIVEAVLLMPRVKGMLETDAVEVELAPAGSPS